MSDTQILGLGLTAIIGIGISVAVLGLVFGATCLHFTTRMLKFKRRSFGKAFGANILVVFAPAIGSGGAQLLSAHTKVGANPSWPFILGAVLLGLLGALFPILIIKQIYRQTFTKALIAYVITGILEVSVAIVLILAIAAALVAMGMVDRPTAR